MKNTLPKILSIAGSDSGGCAGIQADLRVLNALGCHGSTAITAITAQNTLGVNQIFPLPPLIIQQQISVVMNDIGAEAIKIGMLFNKEIIETVVRICKKYSHIPIVIDPVCVSTSGTHLLHPTALTALTKKLVPMATVITPNQLELDLLLSQCNLDSANHNVAEQLNCKSCLITRGDSKKQILCDELYLSGSKKTVTFKHQKIKTTNTHGSGCSLSTAISAFLAMEFSVEEAIKKAIDFIQVGITGGMNREIGNGPGPLFFGCIPNNHKTLKN